VVSQRIAAISPDKLAITIITVEEQIRGRLAVIKRQTTTSSLVCAYQWFHATLDYFAHLAILDFDQAAYEQYQKLRQQKVPIGTQDLRIAAIVLTANGILVTRNQRDFSQVPGLAIEDWSSLP
jgi:tRNA(fMet)-specific endonuclease VapC